MQWWGRRGAIRAVSITGALTTLATSSPALDARAHEVRVPTTATGLMLTAHMTPELTAMAQHVELQVWWSTGLGVSEPALLVTPESDALEPLRLTLVDPPALDDAGNPSTGKYLWRARYSDIKPACPSSGECTVRFWLAPEPGSNTADLAGTISATSVARGPSGGRCGDHPSFPEAAVLTLSTSEIEAAP